MANALYPSFKEALLNKEHDLNNDSIVAMLFDVTDDAYDSANTAKGDLVAGAIVASSSALTSPTIASGVFDTADFTWSSVTGDECEGVILFNDTHATDDLIAFYDDGMTGMPVTPNTGDINFTVNASGWFAL